MQVGLTERRESLEAIAAGLAQQAAAVESTLGRLTAMLSDALGTAEGRVVALADSIRERTEQSANNASTTLTQTMTTAQEQIATFSAELFRLGESLTRVTEQSTRSASGRITETLRGAEQRVAEVAEVVRRVTEDSANASAQVLAEALERAEKQVAGLSEALGQKAEEAARVAIGHFETMRLAATAEGKRAVESVEAARLQLEAELRDVSTGSGENLRAAAHLLVEEVTRAVAEATKRFGATATDIRNAAQEMQRELTETREQLQKGVLDMPAEAREASAAMRSAIGEQIEAINELSKIVARYAGESTALPPAPPPAPMPMAVETARGDVPTRQPSRPEEARPALKQAARSVEAAKPADAYRPGVASAGPNGAATKPLVPAAQPQESRARASNGEGRGWVADLLRRASSSEEEGLPAAGADMVIEGPGGMKRSPAQVVESLNALSIDIARAIDHETSVELWDRYKRGERNVFTRRLYTLQGQKTFDELRRKYERDGEFRKAVDNYIGDFERLLGQVSKGDQDPAMAKAYLTSDTGKVYTMLAHAAGKLS
jgi:uncharacterized phage infection (PIP) family protein YhgE